MCALCSDIIALQGFLAIDSNIPFAKSDYNSDIIISFLNTKVKLLSDKCEKTS